MDLEVRHLRLVRAVAALGGLTRAGRELHLTQSALSHQLRDVESHLGTQIFLRVGKRMVLTSAGERLLRSADEILDRLERTEDAIRGLAGGQSGRLRVSTGCYTQYHWLPHVLRRLRAACPRADVQIVAGAGRQVDELLLTGVDVGTPIRRSERPSAHPLFDDELWPFAAGHRLASKRFLTPEDFEVERCCSTRRPRPMRPTRRSASAVFGSEASSWSRNERHPELAMGGPASPS